MAGISKWEREQRRAAEEADRNVIAAYEFAKGRLIGLTNQGPGTVGMSVAQAYELRLLLDEAFGAWDEGDTYWQTVVFRLASLWPLDPNYHQSWRLGP